jgi:hypothetical protein
MLNLLNDINASGIELLLELMKKEIKCSIKKLLLKQKFQLQFVDSG